MTAAASSPEEFQTLIDVEVKQWTGVAKEAGMAPQ
jgi:tripartite-type tricarboxylate transporter receptor subunit TctC